MDNFEQNFSNHTHDGINSKRILQSCFVTVTLENILPVTGANYGIFFVATRPCVLKAVSEVHTTAGSSTPTLQIERLTGVQAPDSGTVLLSTAFNLAGTANTVQRGVLLKIPLGLNQGDRLCLKDIGTLTAVAGLCVTCEIEFK